MDTTSLSLVGNVWHGHVDGCCMFMSQETLLKYLNVYLEGMRQFHQITITRDAAIERVTRLSYWTYAHHDRDIHFVRLPGCILKESEQKGTVNV